MIQIQSLPYLPDSQWETEQEALRTAQPALAGKAVSDACRIAGNEGKWFIAFCRGILLQNPRLLTDRSQYTQEDGGDLKLGGKIRIYRKDSPSLLMLAWTAVEDPDAIPTFFLNHSDIRSLKRHLWV